MDVGDFPVARFPGILGKQLARQLKAHNSQLRALY